MTSRVRCRMLARFSQSATGKGISNVNRLVLLFLALAVTALPGRSHSADWRDDIGTFRIGLVRATSIPVSALEPFRLAIQEALGTNTEFFLARDLQALIAAQGEGRVEYSIMPASGYAATWLTCECVEPLAIASSSDGSASFRTVLIVREVDSFRSPADLAGREIRLLSPDSIAGEYLFLAAMRSGGLDLARQDTRLAAMPGPHEALGRFAAGEGDALIGWSSMTGDPSLGYSRGTLRQLANLAGGSASAYRIIWKSGPVPNRVHLVRRNLAPEARQILSELLKGLKDDDPVAFDAIEPVFSGGFLPGRQEDFAAILEAAGSVLRPDGIEAAPTDGQATGSLE